MNDPGLTLFVGAGISVPSGAPDFRRLRDMFLTPLVGEAAADVSMDLLSPELLFDSLDDGRPVTRRMIRRAMWWECEAHSPGLNHHAVAALGAAGARVWTTNFDTLIERAAHAQGMLCTTVTPPDRPDPRPGVTTEGRMLLHKPHGSFPLTGTPPLEPATHDYDLLFRSSDVWRELDQRWARRLFEDIAGRHVHLFGYRGADLDVVPVLLRALPEARSVTWWEMDWATENLDALTRRFGALGEHVQIRASDPSAELQRLTDDIVGSGWTARIASGPEPARRHPELPLPTTWTAKAALAGQFRGAAAARRRYARAVISDPRPLKVPAAWRLLRSTGFDRPKAGTGILTGMRSVATLAPKRVPRALWEMYATLLDAQPLRASHRSDVDRLLGGPHGGDAELLVRVASIEKRDGDLHEAARHAHAALRDLAARGGPDPQLEAMTAYNRAWIDRQRWKLDDRRRLRDEYRARMPHIGFNWMAWLTLDDALLALNHADPDAAAELLDGPLLRFARERVGHPMYLADELQARALLHWHRHGPDGVEVRLDRVLKIASASSPGRMTFTGVDTLILLADHARVTGRSDRARELISVVRRASRSRLQHRRAELVEATCGGASALAELQAQAHADGMGLIAFTARVAGAHASGLRPPEGPAFQHELPLAGLY